jgi:hypothetical protein
MNASNFYLTTPDLFQGKTESVWDLYQLLLSELKKLGPIQVTMKSISISLENRRTFASAIIRNRSIKLIFRTNHKIASSRIRSAEHIAKTSYDHTIFIESQNDIDEELMGWLEDAYQTSK